MSQKIDDVEFNVRLKNVTSTIIPISDFQGLSKPMKYKCLVCDNIWDVKEARSVINGYGCPKCAKQKRCKDLKILSKYRTKTEEQFRKELSIKQPNLIPNDKYINEKTKYHCICKIHNCDVYTTPEKMLHRNQGCKLCTVERNKCATRYTHDTFIEKVSSINENILITSKYSDIKKRVNAKCKICGYEWNPIAESLISKTPCGCPSCAGNAIKTPEQFEEELSISHPYLSLLSNYIRSNKEVHVKCNDCGNDFWITPNKLQQGQQCLCKSESRGENRIRLFLENHNIPYKRHHPFDDLFGESEYKKLSYDFYLLDYNLLIEFQGEQHEKPSKFGSSISDEDMMKRFNRQQEHDKRKRKYAKEHNIDLLEIWYWDYKNIESILSVNLLKAG